MRSSTYQFEPPKSDPKNLPLMFDPNDPVVKRGRKRAKLTPMTSRALEVLIQQSGLQNGKLIKKDSLRRKINCQSDAALNEIIFELRKALKKLSKYEFVETVPREGYRFIGIVMELHSRNTLVTAVCVLDRGELERVLGKSELEIGLTLVSEFAQKEQYTFRFMSGTQYKNFLDSEHTVEADYVFALKFEEHRGVAQASACLLVEFERSPIWVDVFEEPIKDEYDSWNRILERVAGALHSQLRKLGRQPQRPVDSKAIHECKTAITQMMQHPLPATIKSAEKHLREALSHMEGYMPAKVWLALNLIWQALFGLIEPAKAFDEASLLAQEARDNGEELAGAYCSLGFIQLFERNFTGAEDSLNKSLNYDSEYSLAYEGYAILQTAQANFKEALDWIGKAIEINHKRFFCYAIRGIIYYEWGKDGEAIQALEECKELEPYFDAVFFGLALAHTRMKKYKKAIAYANESLKLSDSSTLNQAMLAYIHAVRGSLLEARETADKLSEAYESKYVSPYYLSILYAQLGEGEAAKRWMEKAEQVKDPWRLVRPFDDRSKVYSSNLHLSPLSTDQ